MTSRDSVNTDPDWSTRRRRHARQTMRRAPPCFAHAHNQQLLPAESSNFLYDTWPPKTSCCHGYTPLAVWRRRWRHDDRRQADRRLPGDCSPHNRLSKVARTMQSNIGVIRVIIRAIHISIIKKLLSYTRLNDQNVQAHMKWHSNAGSDCTWNPQQHPIPNFFNFRKTFIFMNYASIKLFKIFSQLKSYLRYKM